MTGTTRPRGRPKTRAEDKPGAKAGKGAAKVAAPAKTGVKTAPEPVAKPVAKARKAPVRSTRSSEGAASSGVPTLENVAELTAADLVASGEVSEPVARAPAPETVEPEVAAASPEKPEVPEPQTLVEETISESQASVETVFDGGEGVDQKGMEIMADVMETTKKYADEAKERFQSAFAEMSEKAKASVEKSTKAIEEFSEIAKGNVEALVESGKIASKGMESMGQEAAEYGRVSFEKASAAMKSLAAAKSPAEFFQLQSELLSSTFDAFAKESAKTSEVLLKLAGDVVQPISTRVSVVTEKVRTLAA